MDFGRHGACRFAGMTPIEKPTRAEPGVSEEARKAPASDAGQRPAPAPRPGRQAPDKEGGAPVDELDLDGDGSRRQ
jgi:hypothetical protein